MQQSLGGRDAAVRLEGPWCAHMLVCVGGSPGLQGVREGEGGLARVEAGGGLVS